MLGLLVLVLKYHDAEKPHSRELDLSGAGLLMVAATSILALASDAGPGGFAWWVQSALLLVAIVTVIIYVRHARTLDDPILPPWLVTDRAIGPAILGSLTLGACFLCLDTYVPLYVQGGRGGGVAAAAGVVTPVMMTWALSGIVAAPMIVRWGFRRVALFGTTLVTLGFTGLVVAAFTGMGHGVITAVLALTGCGFGPTSMSYLLAAQSAVPWQRRGVATAGIAFFRTFGGAVGIGLLGTLFNILSASSLARLSAGGVTPAKLLDPISQASLSGDAILSAQHTIAAALLWVFVAILAFAAAGIVITLLMVDRPLSTTSASELRDAAAEGIVA